MRFVSWREQLPSWAMQAGGLLGAIGMIASQVASKMPAVQVIFTAVVALVFLGAVWLLANGAAARVARTGQQRVPTREPLKMMLLGLMVVAIVLWLLAGYGTFIAILWGRAADAWSALAYFGVAICATGATFMVRQARREWLDRYRKGWFSRDDE